MENRRSLVRRASAAFVATLLVPIIAIVVPGAPASAADGDLDTAWGTNGIAADPLAAFGGIENPPFSEWDSVTDGSGRLVVVGTTRGAENTIVARFLDDGSLDTSFGGDGFVEYDVANLLADQGKSIAVFSDGDIAVGGEIATIEGGPRVFALRLNDNGTLDTSFGGGDGTVIVDPSGGGWSAGGELDITGADPNEQIYLGAWREGDWPVYVARLNGDGTPDTSFGGGDGVGELDFGGTRSVIYDLDTGPNSVYVSTEDRGPDGAGVGKLTNAGAPDASFATDGTTVLVGGAWGRAIDVDSAGKVVLAHNALPTLRVSMLTAAGALDPTFSGDGVFEDANMLGVPNVELRSVRFDIGTDEIFVFGGGGSGTVNAAAARITRAGALNPAFGGDGRAQIPSCGGGAGGQTGVVNNGVVTIAASCQGFSIAAGRLLASGISDPSWSADGLSFALPGQDVFAVDSVVGADGSTTVLSSVEYLGGSDVGAYVARFDASGERDDAFNSLSLDANLTPLAITAIGGSPDVAIVGTGLAGVSWAARLLPDGALSPTFGTGGYAAIDFGSPFGGPIATDVVESPDGALLAAGFARAGGAQPQQVAITRINAITGIVDSAFGLGGTRLASAIAGTDNRGSTMAVAPDGSVVVAGEADDGSGQRDSVLVRFTPTGAVDGTFGIGGSVVLDQTSSGDDGANAVAIGPSNAIAMVSSHVGTGTIAVDFLDSAGILQWGTVFGGSRFPTDIAFDDAGRVVVALHDTGTPTGPEAWRFLSDGTADSSFGGDGRAASASCLTGLSAGLGFAGDGDLIIGGSCPQSVNAVRFQASGDSTVSNLSLTVNPDPGTLNTLDIPIDAVDRSRLMPDSSTLASSPWRTAPWRIAPWRIAPWRIAPWRIAPWRIAPTSTTPWRIAGPPILLSSMPLSHPAWPEGWQQVLDEHPELGAFRGRPVQSVTMQELPDAAYIIPSGRPEAGTEITMDHIDFTNTPVGELSLAALLYGATPLIDIDPARDWAFIAPGYPADEANLTDLHFGGADMSRLWNGDPIHLNDPDSSPNGIFVEGGARNFAPGSPLATMHLNGLDLAGSRLGTMLTRGSQPVPASFYSCVPSDTECRTLAEAQQAGALTPDATLVALLDAMSHGGIDIAAGGALVQADLADVVNGFAEVDEFPYEDVPLDQLIALEPGGEDDGTRYTADFGVECAEASGFNVDLVLPAGIHVAETAEVTYEVDIGDGATAPETDVVDVDGPQFFGDDGRAHHIIEFSSESGPACTTGPTPFTVVFNALGAAEQRAYEAMVEVDTGASSAFDTEVVDPSVEPFESGAGVNNNARATAPVLVRDRLISGYISSADDIDYFKIPVGSLPEGSRVTAILSHLPQDYDAVMFGEGIEGNPANGTIENSPWRIAPWRIAPWRIAPVEDAGLLTTQGNVLTPETVQDIPWRIAEVADAPWRTASINRGTVTEVATTTVNEGDTELSLQISGYDGAFDTLPYVVRLKIDEAEEDLECITRPYPARVLPATATLPPTSGPAVDTLILVNEERFKRVYPTEAERLFPTGSASPLDQLALASNGLVIPVDADPTTLSFYDLWDQRPCSIEAANDVVGAVNRLVDRYQDRLGSLKHIVLVGNDELLPHARLKDETTLGNQIEYRRDAAFNGLDNPISRAFSRQHLISDDPYGDFDSVDGEYYLPDVGIGRLVETPGDIAGTIGRFLAAEGALNPTSSFTTGYDFLTDGATAIDSALRSLTGPNSTIESRIDEDWTRTDVINALAQSPSIASINAHYNHYGSLPAFDHAHNVQNPNAFTTADLGQLTNALLFTIGCNAGVSFSDVIAAIGPGGSSADPTAKDWAQVTAEKGATFAGNTGFGYGDTETIALSERLFVGFASQLATKSMTIGQAFAQAKHEYVSVPVIVDDYDKKVTQQAVLYGLPMFRVGTDGLVADDFMPEAPSTNGTDQSTSAFDISPYTPDGNPITADDVEAERGRYWRARNLDTTGGLVQPPVAAGYQEPEVTHYRPLQPKVSVPVTSPAGQAAHGVLLEDLESVDVSGINPVYAMPTRDDGAVEAEPIVDEVFFPSAFANLSRTRVPGQVREKLNLVPGQFFTPDGVSTDREGTQRLFTRMVGHVLHSASNDFIAPQMRQFDAFESASGFVSFSVEATDPTGTVERVLVLYRDSGSPDWRSAELSFDTVSGRWIGVGPMTLDLDPENGPAIEITDWLAQAVDNANNVAVSTNKGRFFDAETLPEELGDFVVTPDAGADGFFDATPNVKLADPDEGTDYEVSANGGPFVPFDNEVGFSPAGDGVHHLRFRGSNGAEDELALPVDTVDPSITIDNPSPDEELEAGVPATAEFSCVDGFSGIASCEIIGGADPNTGAINTSTSGPRILTVRATDVAGNTTTASVNFTVGGDTPPVLTVTVPAEGAVFYLNEPVTPVVTCSDAEGSATCGASSGVNPDGNLDTSSVGTKTAVFFASDGTTTVSITRTYRVIYKQAGFFAPVDNLPTRNIAKAGSIIPVKFRLTDHFGTTVTTTAAVMSIDSRAVECESGTPSDVIETTTAGNSELRYDAAAQMFIYNWKTLKSWTRCRELVLNLLDGEKQIALFELRK